MESPDSFVEPPSLPPYKTPRKGPDVPTKFILILVALFALTVLAVFVKVYRWAGDTEVILPPRKDGTLRPDSSANGSSWLPPGLTTKPLTGSDRGHSTPVPSKKKDYRLPRDVVPTHYDLMLFFDPDVNARNYSGQVDMTLLCHRSTSAIVLHSINTTKLTRITISGHIKVTGATWRENSADVVTLALDKNLEQGLEYRLSLQFGNTFGGPGFIGIWTDHDTDPNSHTRRIAYVRCFEPDGARLAFPCFDEPDAKATFNVSILHSTSLTARSNMPLLTSQARSGGLVLDTFSKTPLMSTYLVSWAVTDFKHKTKGRVTVVGAQYLEDKDMEDALDVGYKSLEYAEKFLGVKYPLPKLDLVGTETFSFGGIEDWGIVLFKNEYIFGYSGRPATYEAVLHEVFHQWLGDLITNTWWNDIWVQEAPTYYLSMLSLKFVDPDDMRYVEFAGDAFLGPLLYGGRHALFPENSAMAQRWNEDLFGAVIFSVHSRTHHLMRMIHFLLGDADFKSTLSAVIKKYSYKNLNGYEFLQGMTEMQKTEPKVDINTHMLTWFESDGIPVVVFHRNYRNKTITVRQRGFESTKRYVYHIPIVYVDNRKQDVYHPIRYNNIQWMTKEEEHLQDKHDEQTAVLLNPGMIGYYVINYDPRNWALIGQHMAKNPNVMDMFLFRQLCSSAHGLHQRGETELSSWLWIWEGLKGVTDLSIWSTCLTEIALMDVYLVGFDDRDRYQKKVFEIWNLTATSAGFWGGGKTKEGRQIRRVNSYVGSLMCDLDYPPCTNVILDAWKKDKQHVNSFKKFTESSTNHKTYTRPILCLIVRHGDRPTWENIKSWINDVEDKLLRAVLVASLTCSKDDGLLKMAIDLTFTYYADWSIISPPVRHDHRFQRAYLDVFFQRPTLQKNESNMAHHAEMFVETEDDLQKLERRLGDIYKGDDLQEHLTAARETIVKKRKDEVSFKSWLDRRLPPAT